MRGTTYNADFYRGEISRITLWLSQPITTQERNHLQRELKSAQDHLAEFEKGE
jgi:hypothetical protein